MPDYTYAVTRRTTYRDSLHGAGPHHVLAALQSQLRSSHENETTWIVRVEIFDSSGDVVIDTNPQACEACGRDEHTGFRGGLPYCHRHL